MDSKEIVWLAALFHDIGKFSQRWRNEDRWGHGAFTENFLFSQGAYWGDAAQRLMQLASEHHEGGDDCDALIVQLSDWLSAGERLTEERARLPFYEAAMAATVSRVEFREPKGEERFYSLRRLELTDGVIFAVEDETVPADDYRKLWDAFAQRFREFVGERCYRCSDFTTLYFLLKEYGSRIPPATPWEPQKDRTVPDISLFDHSRVACAIAACLTHREDALETLKEIREALRTDRPCSEPKPFLLLRGDLSGIQSFLFRITRDATGKGTTKRLRGRSFYTSHGHILTY
jgi:CRISPR-associated protein Csm1